MGKKSRQRELARAAAKREVGKQAVRRKTTWLKTGIVVVVSLAVIGALALLLSAKKETKAAAPTPSTPSPASPSPRPDFPCSKKSPPPIQPFSSKRPLPMTIDPSGHYLATIDTTCGSMVVRFLPQEAPQTVNNFVGLAEKGYYDGIVFHRVANDIQIIQAGDPNCSVPNASDCGQGGPGYSFPDELSGKEKYTPGTVAMANSGADTNGSQFFIVTGSAAEQLPPSYTVFGELVGKKSMATAQEIQGVPLEPSPSQEPVVPVWIRGITVRGR